MGAPRKGKGKGKAGDAAPEKSGKLFGGGGFASFGDYMVEKNRKLKEQFAAAADAGSGCSSKPAIFSGLSFWMTGRTCLPDQELKRIIVEHGGVYEQYGFTHVTHVIADNLASGNQTWAQLKRRAKRVNVVASTWVLDCVKEKRRLPELRYMPACLSTPSSMLSYMGSSKTESTQGQAAATDAASSAKLDEPPSVSAPASCLRMTAEQTSSGLEKAEESPPRKKQKQMECISLEDSGSASKGRAQQPPPPATFALEVGTRCEGLAGFQEFLEVLSDLADSAVRQLCEQGRCCNAAGLRITATSSEWSGTAGVEATARAADLLPVLSSLAGRAAAALGLGKGKEEGYGCLCQVEVRLQCQALDSRLQVEPDMDDLPPTRSCSSGPPSVSSGSDDGHCDASKPQTELSGTCCGTDGAAKACNVQPAAIRPNWKELPVWASERAGAEKLVRHWRGICQALQGMRSSGLRAWRNVCEPIRQPSVTASLSCHVDAFQQLVASHELEVVHLALRALRVSTVRGVPSTLDGEGQLPTPEQFNSLLDATQRAVSHGAGARLKVAPLPVDEMHHEGQELPENSRADHRLQPCRCLVCRTCAEKVACGQHSACPLCEMKVQWLADERALIATGWRVARPSTSTRPEKCGICVGRAK
ncbi:unnamed protein product [Effrenium voratum]|uniref:BRCT domain-containing protein n=1 Tax=Effrenium voratum TaxID=2562239 RepID=A0AA36NGF7_9DINO|nr:unnamed protein product [Effrenium voratum]